MQRIELLRDVFVWAYERSCRRYTVIRDALPEPDPLRLKYRQALIDTIGAAIDTRSARDDAARIRELARTSVAEADLESFVSMVLRELHHLDEGNIARYRVRPSQFRAWLVAQAR
jgi:hypothetical protein